jgi:hypothetical protein
MTIKPKSNCLLSVFHGRERLGNGEKPQIICLLRWQIDVIFFKTNDLTSSQQVCCKWCSQRSELHKNIEIFCIK